MFIEYEYTSKGNGHENEDIYGYADNVFWVIDGATPVFDEHFFSDIDDTAFFVRLLNNTLLQEVSTSISDSLCNIIQRSVQQVRIDLNKECVELSNIPSWKLPSFTIAMGRINENSFDYYVLGDCELLYQSNKNNCNSITDERIKHFSEKNRAQLKELLQTNSRFIKEDEKRIYQETRKMMNTKGGYWVGSVDGNGLEHAVMGTISVDSPSFKCLCFSDGFRESGELFGIAALDGSIFSKNAIKSTIDKLREKQNMDTERTKYVRVRMQDDVTVLFVKGEK